RGDQIHHLDGDRTNTVEDNLILLCLKHHARAEAKSSMQRGLDEATLRQFREEHYERISQKRNKDQLKLDRPIVELSEVVLLKMNITSEALLEAERIELGYLGLQGDERAALLNRLEPFVRFNNARIASRVADLVAVLANYTRHSSQDSDVFGLLSVAQNFFPRKLIDAKNEHYVSLARYYISAGNDIIYDAAIHLKNPNIVLIGLTMLKLVYMRGRQMRNATILKEVNDAFDELPDLIKRDNRPDLDLIKEMIAFYRKQLAVGGLSYPVFPPHIMRMLENGVPTKA
ncbi:MAG TPA: hypothetical protein PK760_10420, partial [Flavobacteriales bacterium]|nr:hypothetical protein [Flavobacteriales bacterium]